MVESVRVPGKGRIRASIEKLFGCVPKNGPISVTTEKCSNPCQYQEKVESVLLPKNCLNEYQKIVEFMQVPENGRIGASIGKR